MQISLGLNISIIFCIYLKYYKIAYLQDILNGTNIKAIVAICNYICLHNLENLGKLKTEK